MPNSYIQNSVALYRRQLDAGFAGLRFSPVLESAFLEDFRQRRMRFTQTGLLLGAAFYTIYLLVKLVTDEPSGFLFGSSCLRLTMIMGLVVTARIVSRVSGGWRDFWVITNYCLFAVASNAIEVMTIQFGEVARYEGMVFAVFHACLFGGLLLRPCLATLCTMVCTYSGLGLLFGLPLSELGYQSFFLVLASIMGIVGLYLTEHAERDNFLRRHLMTTSANFDELTGLASRSAFDHYLKLHLRRVAGTTPSPQAIVLVDLDHFKQLNDSRGHDSGDKCLQLVADILKRTINGPAASVGRWGGDELIAVLPAPDAAQLEQRINTMRREVEQLHMENPDAPNGRLTISAGVLLVQPEQRLEEKMLFRQTDAALYEAKQNGRNRVIVHNACADSTLQTVPPRSTAA